MFQYYRKFKFFVRTLILNSYLFIHDQITILIQKQRIKKAGRELKNQESIGIITDLMLPRVKKIISGLENAGYKVILLTKDSNNFSNSFKYKSPFKALWLAKQFNPIVYHIFSSWSFDTAAKIIRNKEKLPPVIFDDYDVLAGMINEKILKEKYPKQVELEKYCLENADGICCRSLETQHLKRELKYSFKKRIFFPEYFYFSPKIDKTTSGKDKTLVYIGGFNTSAIKLAIALQEINWKLEIYPAAVRKHTLTGLPDNLIFNNSLESEELISALKSYNVAIQFPGSVLDPGGTFYTKEKLYMAAAGKIFDYMEAGLSVLIADEIHQKWILKRYGAAIEIDDVNPVDDIIKKLSNFEAGKNKGGEMQKHLEKLTMEIQIKRLIKFYQNLKS